MQYILKKTMKITPQGEKYIEEKLVPISPKRGIGKGIGRYSKKEKKEIMQAEKAWRLRK